MSRRASTGLPFDIRLCSAVQMYSVYILQSERNGRRYVGSTGDIGQRVDQHNSGMSNSTRPYRPWSLIYSEEFQTRSEAVRRESQIKSWRNRDYLDGLIKSKSESRA